MENKQEKTLGEKVIAAIVHGRLDDDLERIVTVLSNRRKYIQDKHALELLGKIKPGDAVRVGQFVRPKYLAGLHGTVVEIVHTRSRGGFPMIRVDFGYRVRRYGPRILFPLSLLEILPGTKIEKVVTL